MNRILFSALAGAVLAAGFLAAPARAGVVVEVYPPWAYVATSTPVYYEGHAAYWYRDRWYWREGRVWRRYDEEPRYLREWRGHHEPERHYYRERHW